MMRKETTGDYQIELTKDRKRARYIHSLMLADSAARNLTQRLRKPIFIQVA